MHCPSCGIEINVPGRFCAACGADLNRSGGSGRTGTEHDLVCPGCRLANEAGRTVCARCGTDLRTTCPKCNAVLEPGSGTCPGCDLDMQEAVEQLEKWRREAVLALQRGDHAVAETAAGRWYRLARFFIEAGRFSEEVESKLAVTDQSHDTPDEGRPGGTRISEAQARQMESLLKEAEAAESNRDWTAAVPALTQLSRHRPADTAIGQRLEVARDEYWRQLQPLLREAEAAAAEGSLKTACDRYEELCRKAPWHIGSMRKLALLREERRRRRQDREKQGKTAKTRLAWAAVIVVAVLVIPVVAWKTGWLPGAAPVPESGQAGQPGIEPQAAAADKVPPGTRKSLLVSGTEVPVRWIPAGQVVIGSPEDEFCRDADETMWTARISNGFWLGETEVTRRLYHAVMGEEAELPGPCPECPADQVSWFDAARFVERINSLTGEGRFRLPCEVEWEYAARAGSVSPFSLPCDDFGPDSCSGAGLSCIDRFAWHFANSADGAVKPVGLKLPNAWGLHDLHGNVPEWCQDYYGTYPEGVRVDYAGPASGARRVRRGGGLREARYLRSANRSGINPSSRIQSGFRLVWEETADTDPPAVR